MEMSKLFLAADHPGKPNEILITTLWSEEANNTTNKMPNALEKLPKNCKVNEYYL